jgi:cobyrinic acid a,c-diamide synthase
MSANLAPAFVIVGTSSGSGKTTVTLGLMAALHRRGMAVQPFKCGPDFIDPGLHQLVTGRVSRNLDLWMCGEAFTRATLARHGAGVDITIIEGVMGMFDGGISSSANLAVTLGLPTILVLDVRSMAESAAAVVRGFETLLPAAAPLGVILNRVASPRHLQLVSEAINNHCRAEILGSLPRQVDFAIPSRHLGLLTGDEAPLPPEGIEALAVAVEKNINLERLLSLCRPPQALLATPQPSSPNQRCRIGVARDRAFCFYYQDNLDLLAAAGAELVYFSPISDRQLPQGLNGLYLGGGYPELYARELSENGDMLGEIRNFAAQQKTIYAECGGFMYLTSGIVVEDGTFFAMAGIFPVRASMGKTRAALGYREATTLGRSCFGPPGTLLRGHEFHYSHIETMPDYVERLYRVTQGGSEGYRSGRILGGYLHLHFGFTPGAAEAFINSCLEQYHDR